jgi:hypothetical protein
MKPISKFKWWLPLMVILLGAWQCDTKQDVQPDGLQQRITVSKGETQCAEPWGVTDEKTVVAFLKEKGISKVENFKRVKFSDGPFCAACQCSSGHVISVDIVPADLAKAEALGFKQ